MRQKYYIICLWVIFLCGLVLAHPKMVKAAAVSWDGGASSANWSDANNWSNDAVPTPNDDVTINTAVTINIGSSTTIQSLSIGTSSPSTATILNFSYDAITNGALTISGGNMTVWSGATITHSAGNSVVVGTININVTSGNLNIYGSVNIDGKGYTGGDPRTNGNGPGGGTGANDTDWSHYGGGGGHGGKGSSSLRNSSVVASGGISNDSLTSPISLGSGGGGSGYNYSWERGWGASGGGAVKLQVSGTTTIVGSITANGNSLPVQADNSGGGGGAGGSINIITESLVGSGLVTANGGNGGYYNNYGQIFQGGGGGGGRISFFYGSTYSFSGTLTASLGGNGSGGEAGTINIQTPITGTLISSPFDTGSADTLINKLSWTQDLPDGTSIKFQLRTAPDNNGIAGSWSDWLGPTGTDSFYTDNTGSGVINTNHSDGANDQWIQYKIILKASMGNLTTPVVRDVSLEYVRV